MSPSAWLRTATLFAVAAAGPALAQYPPPPPPSYPPPPPAYSPPPSAYAPPPTYPPPTAYAATPAERGGVQLSAYTGWQMNGDISVYAGKLVIEDAQNYGVALEVPVASGSHVQLLWIYNDTKAHFSSYDPFYPGTQNFGLQQHYFQIGGVKSIRRGKVETFGGGTLGAALFIPGTITYNNGTTKSGSDTWLFAVTLGGGAKVFLTEKVALRLEGRLMLPMYFQGASVVVGGGGAGMAVSAGVPSVQGDFTAGITIAL